MWPSPVINSTKYYFFIHVSSEIWKFATCKVKPYKLITQIRLVEKKQSNYAKKKDLKDEERKDVIGANYPKIDQYE